MTENHLFDMALIGLTISLALGGIGTLNFKMSDYSAMIGIFAALLTGIISLIGIIHTAVSGNPSYGQEIAMFAITTLSFCGGTPGLIIFINGFLKK